MVSKLYFLYHRFCFQFGIRGVTYRLTQGVVKRIIPAVASTNAVIAAACAMEVFKLASSCCANHLQNYMVFNDSCGIYTYAYEPEKKEDCLACSQTVKDIQISGDAKLQEFIDMLVQEASYQMKNPGLRSTTADGKLHGIFLKNLLKLRHCQKVTNFVYDAQKRHVLVKTSGRIFL